MNKYQKSVCLHRREIKNYSKFIVQTNAFTLIELLIVIAIIGILLALSVFGLQGARANSRDAKRKSDLETIRGALELYKSDCNQYPPQPLPSPGQPLRGSGSPAACAVINTYIESMPADPLSGRLYSYVPSGSPRAAYTMCSALEGITTDAGCGSVCGTGNTCSYKVTNP